MIKICSKCHKKLDSSNFHKRKASKDGLSNLCKNCQSDYDKQYYAKNKEKIIESKLKYQKQHQEQKREYDRLYHLNHAKERALYNNKNKERRSKRRKEYLKSKLQDPCFCLSNRTTQVLSKALRLNISCENWDTYFSYSYLQLCQHLESLFTPEMNWDNYGSYWEIDHIIPKNQFNYNNVNDKQYKICWSLANLRPLTIIENQRRPKDGRDISEEIKDAILKMI